MCSEEAAKAEAANKDKAVAWDNFIVILVSGFRF